MPHIQHRLKRGYKYPPEGSRPTYKVGIQERKQRKKKREKRCGRRKGNQGKKGKKMISYSISCNFHESMLHKFSIHVFTPFMLKNLSLQTYRNFRGLNLRRQILRLNMVKELNLACGLVFCFNLECFHGGLWIFEVAEGAKYGGWEF